MQNYKNEFVTIFIPPLQNVSYTVQTYDDINSVYIYNTSGNTHLNISINSSDYFFGTYWIRPNDYYVIKGNAKEKLNAPVIIWFDNASGNTGLSAYAYLIIKRFI